MDALILVCALSIATPDCQRATAQHVFYAPPTDGNLVNCLREGMLYAAQSHLVTPGTYPKIYCQSGTRVAQKTE